VGPGGPISATTRSRSVTRTVSPPAASRTYSLNLFFRVLRPTERINKCSYQRLLCQKAPRGPSASNPALKSSSTLVNAISQMLRSFGSLAADYSRLDFRKRTIGGPFPRLARAKPSLLPSVYFYTSVAAYTTRLGIVQLPRRAQPRRWLRLLLSDQSRFAARARGQTQ
jgi:hypothetical protein